MFQPIKWAIKLLPESAIKFYTQTLFGCLKCCSFWVCLLLSHNIFLAAGAAFLAHWYDYLLPPKIKIN